MTIKKIRISSAAFLVLSATSAAFFPVVSQALPKCLFISSYHRGYAWSDGVERGLRSVLAERCEVRQFDMDTKRQKSAEYKKHIGEEARDVVQQWQPDVVITADDNAAKYVIQPYFKNHNVPFVFSGVNWTAKEYGFPYKNVTGIVEVAPIKPMLERADRMVGSEKGAFYLGADTLTEKKNLRRFQQAADDLGMKLHYFLASSMADWEKALADAQNHSFIVMGSNSGINDWDKDRAMAIAARYSNKLSTTNHGWMMPYTMLGMTKVPEEHGEWSAAAALAIIDGTKPTDIPIMSNRKWDIWVNPDLLKSAGLRLPRSLRSKAKRYN